LADEGANHESDCETSRRGWAKINDKIELIRQGERFFSMQEILCSYFMKWILGAKFPLHDHPEE